MLVRYPIPLESLTGGCRSCIAGGCGITGGRALRRSTPAVTEDEIEAIEEMTPAVIDQVIQQAADQETPSEPGVIQHARQRLSEGTRGFIDNVGSAVSQRIMPIVIDRIIASLLGRLGVPQSDAQKDKTIKGGARMIGVMGRRLGIPVNRAAVERGLYNFTNHRNRALARRQIMPYIGGPQFRTQVI